MKNCNAPKSQTTRRIRPIACAAALATAFTVALAQPARAALVTPPPVPVNLQVPAGAKAFLKGHAVGTQNYVCLPAGEGFKFTLFTPQATLFDDDDKEVITHFFGPNPFEDGTIRATWQHARDTSTVWGKAAPGDSSSDPAFVAQGAIPWVKLTAVGVKDRTPGGDALTATTFVQRLNTSGGAAPSTGCVSLTDVGHQAFVPYAADYFFFTGP